MNLLKRNLRNLRKIYKIYNNKTSVENEGEPLTIEYFLPDFMNTFIYFLKEVSN